METLGILAGSGQFPFLVAEGAKKKGMRVVACGFVNNTDPQLAKYVDAFALVHLGQLNSLIRFFKKYHVRKACMAGAISKPKALDIRPDIRAAKLLFRLARKGKGDDAILRMVMGELEKEGFLFIRPDMFVPSLESPKGLLTKKPLSDELLDDIIFGWNVVKYIGKMDIGQCVVVKNGIVVAVEAIEGTDAAVERAASLAGVGCTVVKTAKPNQEERLDLPSIGFRTMELLAKHKFCGIAYEAGKTLFFDQEKSIAYANAHKLFIAGIEKDPSYFK